MQDIIQLAFETNLEVRDVEKREVFGKIVPYGERVTVRGRPESFQKGAFAGIDALRTKLLAHHDPQRPIGRMVSLEEREDGAYAAFVVSRTREGDELLQLVQDGVMDAFSVGFIPGDVSSQGVHVRVQELPEVSLVTWGQYKGARVLATRQQENEMEEDKGQVTLTQEDLDAWDKRMADFSTSLDTINSTLAAPPKSEREPKITPLRWFMAQLDKEAGDDRRYTRLKEDFAKLVEIRSKQLESVLQVRDIADITGVLDNDGTITDASGLVAEEFLASQLVSVLDARRPLIRNLGDFPMPRSGYAVIPIVTQHTNVGARPSQKAEATSRKLIVDKESFAASWFSGAVDIALELIRSAEIGVIDLVWNDLLGMYAQVTEAAVVTAIDNGGLGFTYTGTPLLDGSPTYSEFITTVLTQADVVEDATGLQPNRLALPRTVYNTLMGLVDSAGRRVFAVTNGQNSDGSAAILTNQFTIDGTGLTIFKVKNLDAPMLYHTDSLKFADGGPERVQATNVQLMGEDLGVLGRTMFVPRIPAGVVVFGSNPES